jgi:hypothetical protein
MGALGRMARVLGSELKRLERQEQWGVKVRGLLVIATSMVLALPASLMLAAPPRHAENGMYLRLSSFKPHDAKWVEVDTDACGDVANVTGERPMPTAFGQDMNGDDGDEPWVNSWQMTPEESEKVNEWLRKHPSIATITSGILRACQGDEAPPIDDFDTSEIA